MIGPTSAPRLPLNWRLPPLRHGYAADQNLKDRRARSRPPNPNLDAVVTIGGCQCYDIRGLQGEHPATLIYFHGGGYRLGSPAGWKGLGERLAEAGGARIVLPTYRLAPENPFPAALHDAVAVYREMRSGGDAKGGVDREVILVGGDSAGAGLAAALCQLAATAGEPVDGLILLSPMLDLTAGSDSYRRNAGFDTLFSAETVGTAANNYLQGHSATDPLVSPLRSDPQLYPRTLVMTGTGEVVLDEAVAFAQRLVQANRSVTLRTWAGQTHVWPLIDPFSNASIEAVAAIANFISETAAERSGHPHIRKTVPQN